MSTEKATNQEIEIYLKKLVFTFGIQPIVNEAALKIQFEHGLYAECIYEIMRKMGLQNRLKVKCYADYKYPDPKSIARIYIPNHMAFFGSREFNSQTIQVEMTESLKKNFYAFITAMSHELCHIILKGMNHELKNSEIATDLCMLIFGYSNFARQGRIVNIWTFLGFKNVEVGYLSSFQLEYAIECLEKMRQTSVPLKPEPKIKEINWFDELFKRLLKT